MTMPNAFDPAAAARLDEEEAALVTRRAKLLGPAYRLFYSHPLHVIRAEGVWLHGANGEAYLDAYNNVACVGHCHPRIVEAIATQAAILNTHTRYVTDLILDYAERLLATMPAEIGHVMFTCTGSEANDLALRVAKAATGGTGVIVTENAYHGVTEAVAGLSPSLGVPLSGEARSVARPATSDTTGHAFAARVQAAIADLARSGLRPAALLVDTVFSSDGVFPDPPGFLAPAAEAIRAAGGLLIADEVQAGFGRTGEAFWGFGRHGLAPDIVTMGKPMGNGHPVAAMAARPALLEAFGRKVRYFNTFGGNPVSCAAGMAVLDVIESEGLVENARHVGKLLKTALEDMCSRRDAISQVRGVGLYIGVDIVDGEGLPSRERAAAIVNAMRERRVLISATGKDGNVLKIRPPLVFQEHHAAILADALEAASSPWPRSSSIFE
jgi:4-aminobutyrate aminotransferase-like enzyme